MDGPPSKIIAIKRKLGLEPSEGEEKEPPRKKTEVQRMMEVFELKRMEKDETRSRKVSMKPSGLGCNNTVYDMVAELPLDRSKKNESDDSRKSKDERNLLCMGGGRKTQEEGSHEKLKGVSTKIKTTNLGMLRKKERELNDDLNAPPNPEPRPMGDSVLLNYQSDLRRKNSRGNSNGLLGGN